MITVFKKIQFDSWCYVIHLVVTATKATMLALKSNFNGIRPQYIPFNLMRDAVINLSHPLIHRQWVSSHSITFTMTRGAVHFYGQAKQKSIKAQWWRSSQVCRSLSHTTASELEHYQAHPAITHNKRLHLRGQEWAQCKGKNEYFKSQSDPNEVLVACVRLFTESYKLSPFSTPERNLQ